MRKSVTNLKNKEREILLKKLFPFKEFSVINYDFDSEIKFLNIYLGTNFNNIKEIEKYIYENNITLNYDAKLAICKLKNL